MNLDSWLEVQKIEDGVILFQKPYGTPSTAIVELFKRQSGQKVGHGGTLDPLAEGAMLLGIGSGTKKLTNYLASEKSYSCEISFGAFTASGDLEHHIVIDPNWSTASCKQITAEALSGVLSEFERGFEQEVSVFSAKKVDGKAQYSLARKGKEVTAVKSLTKLVKWRLLGKADITPEAATNYIQTRSRELINSFGVFSQAAESVGYRKDAYQDLLKKWLTALKSSEETIQSSHVSFVQACIEVTVPKGTYIRSLAQSLANRFNTQAVLVKLVRLGAGNFISESTAI